MSPEMLLEQFDVLADAPNGVQKLRELILQLAVRGKLVPQDPSDEPASVLLERIEAEKQRLYREGKIGKPKVPLPVSSDEVPFDVPEGWVWTRLEQIGRINPRNELPDNLVVSFCPMALLPERYGGDVGFEDRSWGEVKKGYTHFAESDVVVAKITPCFQNGKAAVMRRLKGGAGAGTTELHVFRPVRETISPEYVLIFLKSPGFVEGGIRTMTGTAGQQRVSKDYFATTPFPLPPLPEQRRIVEKVDQLMALCDELEMHQRRRAEKRVHLNRASLHHLTTAADDAELAGHWQRIRENFDLLYDVPESVAELRQAILQLAVRGKLVPQDPSDEPASVLLERIEAEKRRLFKGRINGRPKESAPVDRREVAFKAPNGWEWIRFGEATDVASGVTKGRNLTGRKTASFPYLRVANVQRGWLDLNLVKEIEIPVDELDRFRLEPDDILLTEGGDWDKLGRAAIWQGQLPACLHQNHVFRARPYRMGPLPRWFMLLANSPDGKAYFQSQAKQTTNLASINMTQLRRWPCAIPPLAEQRRIVEKVDQLMALCDELESKLTRAREKSEHLAASVVHHLTAA